MAVLRLAPAEALQRSEEGDASTALAILQGIADDRTLPPHEQAGAWSNLGTMYEATGMAEEAHRCYRWAACVDPTMREALSNLGASALGWTKPAEARGYFATALQGEPIPPVTNGWGTMLIQENRYDDALPWLDATLRLDPGYVPARWNRSLVCLAGEMWAEGWREHEARRTMKGTKRTRRLPTTPEWHGEPLDGRRLLVLAEQGFGDCLMWARVYRRLRDEYGATVIAEAHAPLVPLLRAQPAISHAYATSEELPEHDTWVFLCSVMGIMGLTPETDPTVFPYLVPPVKVGKQGERAIGLAWQGRPEHNGDHLRSAPRDWAQELVKAHPDIGWVSLQKDQPPLEGTYDGRPFMADFGMSAGFFDSLDGVVSIDSAPVHLAGALNVPTLCLLPHNAEWRWRPDLGRGRSRWYRSVALAQQAAPGDWGTLNDKVGQWLAV